MILAFLFDKKKKYFSYKREIPFHEEEDILNKAYVNVSLIGRKNGVKVVFSDWKSYSRGSVIKYWVFDNGWKLIKDKIKPDLFFDKFEYSEKANKLKKRLSKDKKLINSFQLEKFCKDKYKQYKVFSDMVPKYFLVKNKNDLNKYFPKIKTKKKVLKPNCGHGGYGIKFISNISEAPRINSDYILQEFIDTSKGIKQLGVNGVHDIRTLIVNDKIFFSFVREPSKGLLANIHQGGTAKLILTPIQIKKKIKKINNYMEKFGKRFYSADFFYSEGKYYLVELNSKPGFDIAMKFGFEKEEKKMINGLFKRVILNA